MTKGIVTLLIVVATNIGANAWDDNGWDGGSGIDGGGTHNVSNSKGHHHHTVWREVWEMGEESQSTTLI